MNNLERLDALIPADVKAKLKTRATAQSINLSSLVRLILTAAVRK